MIRNFSIQRNNNIAEFEAAIGLSIIFSDKPGVMIKTCNRIEFYQGKGSAQEDTIRHLFRVVAGLESKLVGEIAIQGQVKNAYIEASQKFNLSAGLHMLFQAALKAGKRVRTESQLSRGAISHSQVAVETIKKCNIKLDKALITLIGAHKLNEDIIRFLHAGGAETIFLGNKSFDKANELAQIHHCSAFRLDRIHEFLEFSDVLISATSAPHRIITYEMFPKNKDMLVLDLACPQDVDEAIGKLPNVKLFNLDDMERMIGQNLDLRKSEIAIAEQLIEEEVNEYLKKQQRYVNYISILQSN